ncbi:SDR family oxidoreductase [Streptomyces sp. CRN 30]|uniref:SDR family oxidoreductase n=1 Tax=Streptomyces sp. CRN 30 TaxID=3075613 RepID=UPI002A7F0B15|nr:SDR family oxidoreductase [Streptomyces sp. CRN 30]
MALTGATGFLGLRLLVELLRRHRSVTVLARGEPDRVRERVTRALGVIAADVTDLPARVEVVPARITEQDLSLSGSAYRELADSLDVIWHCAGDTTLDGDLAHLRRVNVEGTRHILGLAAAGRRLPAVFHVSTAFVAGARRAGVVYEDELTDAYGFEGSYERSKYEAERLVHTWAGATGRPVAVFRPSVLTTASPPHPDLPEHPLLNIQRTLSDLRHEYLGPGRTPEAVLRDTSRFRVAGRPDGQLNLMPVEEAAAVMARLAEVPPGDGVETYHVVHGRDTPVDVLRQLLERLGGARVEIVPELTDPTPLESALSFLSGVFCYLRQRRRYDDSRVRARLGPPGVAAPMGVEYLLAGLRPRTEAAPR